MRVGIGGGQFQMPGPERSALLSLVPEKRKRESWIWAAFEFVGEAICAIFEALASVLEIFTVL